MQLNNKAQSKNWFKNGVCMKQHFISKATKVSNFRVVISRDLIWYPSRMSAWLNSYLHVFAKNNNYGFMPVVMKLITAYLQLHPGKSMLLAFQQ
jgi:hypothetical protein